MFYSTEFEIDLSSDTIAGFQNKYVLRKTYVALCLIQVYFMQIQTPIQGIKVKLLTSQHVLIEFHLHKMESNLF